jgi:hypothetical protein
LALDRLPISGHEQAQIPAAGTEGRGYPGDFPSAA